MVSGRQWQQEHLGMAHAERKDPMLQAQAMKVWHMWI